ncbi:MAG: hypothetical protein H7Y01_10975 [Ferruginibacter sp.]|nr:hypothetical protein [Chitinophagaceae bacterium]
MKFFFNKRSTKETAIVESIPAGEVLLAADHTMDETAAVIALAIQMYINQVREYENSIITIQKIMKPYSPWSSKIYGMRQQHTHTPALKPIAKSF